MSDKIDFVIAWVDDNDSTWQELRDRHAKNAEGDKRNIRFRDWDNLYFWFRGVEKFAPWVNVIHFVTWGHLPSWLNTDHQKLRIVKHSDYIPGDYLPTFSSHTIELNIHRIESLSKRFVYFNDDTFIIKQISEDNFFKKGLPCDCAVIMPNISLFRNSTAGIVANNMEIINTKFNKNKVIRENVFKWFNPIYKKHLISTFCSMPYKLFTGFFNSHLPISYLVETFIELWEAEKEVLHKTCLNKFRGGNDINQWLFRYWQLVKGQFMPRKISIGSSFSLTNNNEEVIESIIKQKYKMICINDNDVDPIVDFEKEKENIKKAFETILPEKSTFEL